MAKFMHGYHQLKNQKTTSRLIDIFKGSMTTHRKTTCRKKSSMTTMQQHTEWTAHRKDKSWIRQHIDSHSK